MGLTPHLVSPGPMPGICHLPLPFLAFLKPARPRGSQPSHFRAGPCARSLAQALSDPLSLMGEDPSFEVAGDLPGIAQRRWREAGPWAHPLLSHLALRLPIPLVCPAPPHRSHPPVAHPPTWCGGSLPWPFCLWASRARVALSYRLQPESPGSLGPAADPSRTPVCPTNF